MDYALSPDGSVVYRVLPEEVRDSSDLDTSLIKGKFDYTLIAAHDGALVLIDYTAGFISAKGIGGAELNALYSLVRPLNAGESLNWIQVVHTNVPLKTTSTTYLDNRSMPTEPFYPPTAANRSFLFPDLPANQVNFYDFPGRDPQRLQTVNPITWDADLYPVLVNGKSLTIENGVSWGWTGKSATAGTDTGVFADATPGDAVTTGVGTSAFAWGEGQPSSLSFAGTPFDSPTADSFKLGTITYFNGSTSGGNADTVNLKVSVNLTNVPEKDFVLTVPITIVSTPNTDDEAASADTISLGNYGSFHVLEGKSATVDIFGKLSTGLVASTAGASRDDVFSPDDVIDPLPGFGLQVTGLQSESVDGFISSLAVSGTRSGQSTTDKAASQPFAGVTITDSLPDLTHTVTATLSDAANGSLENDAAGTSVSDAGTYTVTGTLAEVSAALDGLSFVPTLGQARQGASITTTITIVDTDSYGSTTSDVTTSVIAASTVVAVITLAGSPGDDGFDVDGSQGVQGIDGAAGTNFIDTIAASGTGNVIVDLKNGVVRRDGQVDASLTNIQGVQLGADTSIVRGMSAGLDILYGGTGDATFIGSGAEDVIKASTGSNTVVGGPGIAIFYGNGGHDLMTGGAGQNYMLGGTSPDGIDDFTGTTGDDFIYGQAGSLIVQAGSGPTYVSGGSGSMMATGDMDKNGLLYVVGNGGTDVVDAGTGTTLLYEGSGSSTFKGGSGLGEVFGGAGQSDVMGGSGTLVVTTGAGDQHVTAGSGATSFNEVADHLTAGRHDVIENFSGGTGAEIYLPTAVQSTTSFAAQLDGTAITTAVEGGIATLLVASTDLAVVQAHTHFTL